MFWTLLFTTVQVWSLPTSGSLNAALTCKAFWNPMAGKPSTSTFTLPKNEIAQVVLDDTSSLSLSRLEDGQFHLALKEKFQKTSENFFLYDFSCSRSLNCKGFRKKQYLGKDEIDTFEVSSGSLIAHAFIGKRKVFDYKNQKGGFSFEYISYMGSDGKNRGAKVSCHE